MGLEAGGLAAGLITLGVRLAETYAITSLITKNLDQPQQSQNTGGTVQLPPATKNKLPVVYGTHHVAPIVVDALLSNDQQTMWFVLALSEATSGSVTFGDVYWDDKVLVFDPNNPSEITSWYVPANAGGAEANSRVTGVAGKISMWFYGNGSYNEVTHQCTTVNNDGTVTFTQQKSNVDAISVLQDGAIPDDIKWTATDLMSDTVFAVCKVVYDQAHTVTALGNLKFELRNTLGTGYNASGAKDITQGPGAVIHDYLINERYGCGLKDDTYINTASLTALNTYAGTSHQLKLTNGSYKTGPRYTINGIVDTAQDCMVNLNVLADNCDSWIQWDERNAKWGVVMNRSLEESGISTSTMLVVTADNLIGGINIIPTDLKSSANKLTIQYPNYTLINQADYRYFDMKVTNPELINPNEPDNNLSVTFPFCDNDLQATWLGYKKLWSTRADVVINFTMDYSGIRIDAGDVIAINHDWYTWIPNTYNNQYFPGKPFRVTQVKESKDANGFLSVQIAAVEYNASIYSTDDPKFFQLTEFNNNLLADPNYIDKPAAPTFSNVNTATSPSYYQVNAVVPAVGRVESMEFWYSNTSTFAINNFALYGTQYYTDPNNPDNTTALYPPGDVEKIIATAIPSGTYYWTVRAIGPQASSAFSDLAGPFEWTQTMAGGALKGGSIADNSIGGSKVITGDPATVGKPESKGFFDTLGPLGAVGLGGLGLWYGYTQGWFDGEKAPAEIWVNNDTPVTRSLFAGGGQGGGGQDNTVTQDVAYLDQNGNPTDTPKVGDTQVINVAMNENYDTPESYVDNTYVG